MRLSVPRHGEKIVDGKINGIALNLLTLLLLLLERLESGCIVTHVHVPLLVVALPLLEVVLVRLVVFFVVLELDDQSLSLVCSVSFIPEICEDCL
jgi:hypothetical protein